MWKLAEVAEGKLSCDNYELKSGDIPDIINKLDKKFDIQYANRSAVTMDMTAVDYYVDRREIVFGWDCWSGIFIMAKKKSENDVIERIYKCLSDE